MNKGIPNLNFLPHRVRVVLNASALPDPQAVSYDLLLSYVSNESVQIYWLSNA